MKSNFEYWIKNGKGRFLTFYWIQYAFFYLLAIWLTLRSGSLLIFTIIGFLPYFIIVIFRRKHTPFGSIEDGIKKYDAHCCEQFAARIPGENSTQPKRREAAIFDLFMKEPDANLNFSLLSFKKNYIRINTHAMLSVSLWFFTLAAIAAYLFLNKAQP